MTDEYRTWLRERELEQRGLRDTYPIRPRASTIKGDVAVPTLQAFAIGSALATVIAGLLSIIGTSWQASLRWGAGAGLFAFGVAIVVFILQHRAVLIDPMRMAWEKLDLARMVKPRPTDEWQAPMVLNPYQVLPAGGTLDTQIKSIEPDAPEKIKELCEFIATMWPVGDVTQAACREKGFTRKYWDRYVGGSRRRRDVGKESARGILDRAGVVHKDGNKWAICAPLNEALAINDGLLAYANAKAKMVTF